MDATTVSVQLYQLDVFPLPPFLWNVQPRGCSAKKILVPTQTF